jgi:hypothetical protein
MVKTAMEDSPFSAPIHRQAKGWPEKTLTPSSHAACTPPKGSPESGNANLNSRLPPFRFRRPSAVEAPRRANPAPRSLGSWAILSGLAYRSCRTMQESGELKTVNMYVPISLSTLPYTSIRNVPLPCGAMQTVVVFVQPRGFLTK